MWGCLFAPGGVFSPRARIPDTLCHPSGLYGSTSDKVDQKRLKRLIVEGKLAPFFPGRDDPAPQGAPPEQRTLVRKLLKQKGQPVPSSSAEPMPLEECPICFLYYPLMNTSRCCGKRVCTDCFLQVCAHAHDGRPCMLVAQ